MPELPEVETIVRGLKRNIIGQPIKAAKVFFAPIVVPQRKSLNKLLDGDKFAKVERHGKYIKLTTKRGQKILIHLRMTGQLFTARSNYQPDKHTHLTCTFKNGKQLVYRDIRKFGRWTIIPTNKDFSNFINAGRDALAVSEKELRHLIEDHSTMKLKAFLLNQNLIAGVGNIYADEICFALKHHPETTVDKVNPAKLHRAIHKILSLAIKHNGTTVSDYRTSRREKGNFQNLLKVYKQTKCPSCKSALMRKKIAGRSSHFCRKCQPKRQP